MLNVSLSRLTLNYSKTAKLDRHASTVTPLIPPAPTRTLIMASTTKPRRLRIMLLHGYIQSGPLFYAKTRAVEKYLRKVFPAPQYALSLEYPTAPIVIKPADIPVFNSASPPGAMHSRSDTQPVTQSATADDDMEAYGWWKRKDRDGGQVKLGTGEPEGFVYEGMDKAMARIADYLTGKRGAATSDDGITRQAEAGTSVVNGHADPKQPELDPELLQGFDGVVGFSQGGCLASMVASLLEPGRREAFQRAHEEKGGIQYPSSFVKSDEGDRKDGDAGLIHPPLKFAVIYSGFAPSPNPLYDVFYDPKIQTPMLHFLGSVDTVVEESRSMRLVDSCAVDKESDVGKRRIVYHPGGHFLPSSKMTNAALVDFIKEAMGWNERVGRGEDRSKEEMDLPF